MPSFSLLFRFALLGVASLVLGYIVATWTTESRQSRAIAEHADAIYRSPASPVAGNPDGDVTVVAFLDYNCPYCRQGTPALQKLLESDGKVRLVLKELPVLGSDSEKVARLALASVPQGKYFDLHEKLMTEPGRATEQRALGMAESIGLDAAKLADDASAPPIQDAIAANKALAASLKVRGVPFYLVGDRVVKEGDDLYGRFAAAVADVRANGCTAKC